MTVLPAQDNRELRRFGLILGLTVVLIFGLVGPWLRSGSFSWWPWVLGVTLALWALTAPHTMGFLYLVWMKVGSVLGRINTAILLTIVFYLIFVPMGILQRLLGKNHKEKESGTYRIISRSRLPKHMERPF